MTDLINEQPHRTWGESIRAFLSPKVIAMLFLGFSAGVPLYLVFSTLSVWLREAGVERATIGFFSWAALAYGFKFVWAPLIDKLPVPILAKLLGRRRAWLLVAQCAIIAALLFMALTDPVGNLTVMALGAVMLAFSSATQDIVIDAYRIESGDVDLQGMMSATYIAGYRIGMLVAGAGALELAGILDVIDGYDYSAWRSTYMAMAGVMGVGIVTTFMISEPSTNNRAADLLDSAQDYVRFLALFVISAAVFVVMFRTLPDIITPMQEALGSGLGKFVGATVRLSICGSAAVLTGILLVRIGLVGRAVAVETYVAPFADFFKRYGKIALWIFLLIATYRIADIVMGVMANVFYVDLGFEKQEIGRISKAFGLGATLAGGFLGGLLMVRYGVMKILWLGGALSAATNVLFAAMSSMAPEIWVLVTVITADNLSAGIAMAAFVAYLSSLTSKGFTATQYALFSSIMMLGPKLLAGYSGVAVDAMGYAPFFIATAIIGVIPLVLIVIVARSAPGP